MKIYIVRKIKGSRKAILVNKIYDTLLTKGENFFFFRKNIPASQRKHRAREHTVTSRTQQKQAETTREWSNNDATKMLVERGKPLINHYRYLGQAGSY
jgi:hypothetical protein